MDKAAWDWSRLDAIAVAEQEASPMAGPLA